NTMPFSPTLRIGLNDLALSGLLQQSTFTVQPANNSTNTHFNNSTPEEHTRAESLNEIHAYLFYCGIWVNLNCSPEINDDKNNLQQAVSPINEKGLLFGTREERPIGDGFVTTTSTRKYPHLCLAFTSHLIMLRLKELPRPFRYYVLSSRSL
ncbi:hypothetical protein, partial [Tannerella forsythia]|uniref:hypothetical protein n=1 Tax=Tannerella forsythia TaxID=28112 RepID=UPI00163AB37E